MNDQLALNDHYPFTDLILFVLYLISISLALTSNSIILTVFIRKRKASPTYNLMSNMAISDMLSASFILLQWYFCSNVFFSNQSTNMTTLNNFDNLNSNLNSFNNLNNNSVLNSNLNNLNNLSNNLNNNLSNSLSNFNSLNNLSNEQSNLILDLNIKNNHLPTLNGLPDNQNDSTGSEFERKLNDLNANLNYRNDEINNFSDTNKSESNNYQAILRNQLNQLNFLNHLNNDQNNRNMQSNNFKMHIPSQRQLNERQPNQRLSNEQLSNERSERLLNERNTNETPLDKILFKDSINRPAFVNHQIKLINQLLNGVQPNSMQSNDRISNDFKSISEQAIKTNFQPSKPIESALDEKINPINDNTNQGERIANEPLSEFRNNDQNDQINHRISLLNHRADDRSHKSLENQRTHRDLIANNLESEEKLQKKRDLEEVDQLARQRELFEMTTASNEQDALNAFTDNLVDKEEQVKESKFRNFVNQFLSSNKLIKSQFVSRMPNCGQRVCGILEVLQMTFYYVSTLSMTGIAYNRNQLINNPLAPKMDVSLFITTIWLTSLSMAFVISLSSLRVFVFFVDSRFIGCQIILNSSDGWSLRKWRAMVLVLVQYILPLSCICYFYVNVIKELRKSASLVRTKHQSSTSSNNQSIENYVLMNRRVSTGTTMNYNSIANHSPKLNLNRFESNASKEENPKAETNNNNEQAKLPNSSTQFKLSSLKNFKSINLVNLPLIKKLNRQSTDDLNARQCYVKNKANNSQLNKILGKKLMNGGRQMNKQSSNESQNTFTSSQSVSHKLNLLDGELDRTKRRLTKMMILVVAIFASAWLPIHIMHIKQFFIDIPQDVNYCNSSFIYLFFYWIAFSTFTYNPLIYMYFSKELRRDCMQTFKSLFKLRIFKSFKV